MASTSVTHPASFLTALLIASCSVEPEPLNTESAAISSGTYAIEMAGASLDGGFGFWGGTPAVQLYPTTAGNNYQRWTYTASRSLQNVGFGKYMIDAGNGTVSESTTADTWTILRSGSGFTLRNDRTKNFATNNGTLAMAGPSNGANQIWTLPGAYDTLAPGNYAFDIGGSAIDGGFGKWGGTPGVQLYAANASNTFQRWTYDTSHRLQNVGFGRYMVDNNDGTVSESAVGDTWTIVASGAGYTMVNDRTHSYVTDRNATLYMSTADGAADQIWIASAGTGTGSGFTPITPITPGAQVVHPGDNIAAIVSACSTGIVHFSAGTYTVASTINVPSHCQVEGELGWVSIVTGAANPIFHLGQSTGATITRLHFKNLNATAISGGDRTGYVESPHIYLNWFDHITGGPGGGSPAIFLFYPDNVVIERNAFDNVAGDSIHLMTETGQGGGYATKFPARNIMVRWNFTSNMNPSQGGFSPIEIQISTTGLHVYQNVTYSTAPGRYVGAAMSIASGGVPCTGGGPSAFTGCLPPENGVNAVFIDGNINLDNGILGPTPNNWGGIETMGPTPLVQNNYERGWSSGAFTGWMFVYNASGNYDLPNAEPVAFQNNTFCDVAAGQVTSVSQLVSPEDGRTPVVIGAGGNVYNASCAGLAPPALPPQIVAAPGLLDGTGGLSAITNSAIPGANTYWPTVNAHVNDSYQ